ncbi:ankyrin [Trematosphaeria pertusa]|uniref:Ankyrin n=1 Tax=Trematosphaeria pertusa TaxID=390896 RepID=A0A6A6HRY6_9PLEO|nr:ankyrin [Trematosphaeria pertusa]KAF2240303.1 ankyrin [Trematosphaeria pertusa]
MMIATGGRKPTACSTPWESREMRFFKTNDSSELNNQLLDIDPSDADAIRSLLVRGADRNTKRKNGKSSPLVSAAAVGCIPSLKVLLDHGAKIDQVGGPVNHETALNAAVFTGSLDAADYLLDRGANIEGVLHMRPIHSALKTKNIVMLHHLLERGANADGTNVLGVRPIMQLVREEIGGCHSLRKPPKETCKTCRNRWETLACMVLLRKYGARAIVYDTGTTPDAVYADIIAYWDRWAERGRRAGEWLAENTLGDPTIQTLMAWGFFGVLGSVGIPTPAQSLMGLMGGPEFKDVSSISC